MRSRGTGLLLVFLWLLAASPLAAQEVHDLDEITVTAPEEVQRIELEPDGNIEVISIREEANPVVSTVPDVLKQTSGVDVQRRSILTPKNSQIRLRGLDESRYNVLLDGRPLNGNGVMGGFFVDWSVLSLRNWETVDVGKGAYSAKYGNTLGGTINLLPKRPMEEPEAAITAGYKRYDTIGTGAYGSMRHGPFGAVATGGYDTTDGNLRNSEAERQDYSGSVYYFLRNEGELRASFRYVNGDFNLPVENRRDLPGFDDDFPESSGSMLIGPGIRFPTGDRFGDGSYYNKKRLETELSYRQNILGFDAEAILYRNQEDRTDHFTSFNLGETVLERDSSPDESWGWTTHFKRPLASHLPGFGADGNYQGDEGVANTFIREGYFPPNSITDGSDESDASRRHGLYLDDTWALRHNLDLYGGLRFDNYVADQTVDAVASYQNGKPAGFEEFNAKFDETTLLPKFGFVYRPLEPLTLYGRAARATRFPTNPEFYWFYAGYRPEVDSRVEIHRKDLSFEDALQWEAGLSYRFLPDLTFWLTYYNYQVDDYIRTIFGYAPSRVVYNIDEATLQGVELTADGRIWGDFFAFANFTYQDTKKEGDVLDAGNALSDELSELPEYKANWGIKYERPDGALARLAFRYVGPTEVPVLSNSNSAGGAPLGSPVELEKLGGFLTMDLFFRYPVFQFPTCRKGVVGFLSAGVENLLDKEYREEFDFPAPGRVFSVSLEMKY